MQQNLATPGNAVAEPVKNKFIEEIVCQLYNIMPVSSNFLMLFTSIIHKFKLGSPDGPPKGSDNSHEPGTHCQESTMSHNSPFQALYTPSNGYDTHNKALHPSSRQFMGNTDTDSHSALPDVCNHRPFPRLVLIVLLSAFRLRPIAQIRP